MRRFGIVLVSLVVVLTLGRIEGTFLCQNTINTYNAHVNVGNFTGAAALTFSENVTYIIPGSYPACPYCQVYVGKAAVISLFVNGFLGHFTILNPLVNLREITSNNGGPDSVPELMDFNDESFRILPQFGGRYFRVHVVHDFLFDASTCLITQMHLYHDPYVAAMAFAGHSAVAVPIMPGLAQIPPPAEFVVNQITGALDNWQVFLGEDAVSAQDAWTVVNEYYTLVDSNQLNNATVDKVFLELDYALPQTMASLIVPGDVSVLPWGSLYVDQPEIVTYHQIKAATVKENTPLDPNSFARNITVNGSVVVLWKMTGFVNENGMQYYSDALDYFQIIPDSTGLPKIARLSRFFDTWNVTLALTGGNPYPQFSSSAKSTHQR